MSYHPFVGGAEVAVKEITDRISPEEIEFHMITLRYDSTLPLVQKIGNVTVYRIGFSIPHPDAADLKKFPLHLNKFFFQFLAAFKAASLHRANKYDAVWALMAHSSAVPAAIFKLLNPDIPYILTLQEGDPPEYIKRKMLPLYPLFKLGFTKADIVSAISVFLGKWAREMGFKGPLEIIPNGVDVKNFSREFSAAELAAPRADLGKKDGDVFLVTSSRLVKKNACDDVIRALKLLPENFHFAIMGTGPDEDALKSLAEKFGLSGRVKFLGQISHEEMPKYLKVSDIFIRPSLSEGFGISFVEAFAAGLPVIATQEGGIADFLFDPELNPENPPTGLAVNPREPEGIARQAKRLAGDAALRARLIQNGLSLASQKYDWNTIARDMKDKVFDKFLK